MLSTFSSYSSSSSLLPPLLFQGQRRRLKPEWLAAGSPDRRSQGVYCHHPLAGVLAILWLPRVEVLLSQVVLAWHADQIDGVVAGGVALPTGRPRGTYI